MPIIEWDDFIGRHPGSHLVTGVYVREERVERPRVLLRLLVALGLKKDYALNIVQDRGLWFTQVGFESEADAKKLASAALAKPKARFEGFATQREFWFDSVVMVKIARALKP